MIPLGVDRYSRHSPNVTIGLVVANILIFLVVSLGLGQDSPWAATLMDWGVFHPGITTTATHPWTLLTYAFLHDPNSLGHVGFNMLFLWVFGRAVEDRLGSWWFLTFYLCGCVAAALGQWVVASAPMIGASGAIAAMTGAFAALCPRARVRVFFFLSIIEVPGLILVIIFVVLDFIGQIGSKLSGGGGIAYSAHLAGYAFGIATMVALLAMRILPRTEFDLFFLFKQAQRRRAMAAATRQADSPWMKDAARMASDKQTSAPSTPSEQPVRRTMSDADVRRELLDASARWTRGEFAGAANAWERFAKRSPSHPDADGALLLAAVTCARKLNDAARARELARRLLDRIPPASVQTLAQAQELLLEIDGNKAS